MDSLALDSNEEEQVEQLANFPDREVSTEIPAGFTRKLLDTSTPTSIVGASTPTWKDGFISVPLKNGPIGPAFTSRSKRPRDHPTHWETTSTNTPDWEATAPFRVHAIQGSKWAPQLDPELAR